MCTNFHIPKWLLFFKGLLSRVRTYRLSKIKEEGFDSTPHVKVESSTGHKKSKISVSTQSQISIDLLGDLEEIEETDAELERIISRR